MATITTAISTGNVTLVAETADTVVLTRAPGEDPLYIDPVYPNTPNSEIGVDSPYKGFRVSNNDSTEVVYYTVSYNNNELLEAEVGAEGTYRLNPGITDQWITDPYSPNVVNLSVISSGTPDYTVEGW